MPVVVKYGGNAMTDDGTRAAVAAEIRALFEAGSSPVVVHGGGPFISEALDAAGLPHRFERGLRVTSPASLEVIERVLTVLSKRLAQDVGPALGLSGRDARLLLADVLDPALGRVGRVTGVNADALGSLLAAGFVPVLACLATDAQGGLLNVNADEVAGAVAGALGAGAVFLTNVPGVMDDPARPDSVLAMLSRPEAEARIRDGRIAGGMIPKVEAALRALELGAPYAIIADGRRPASARDALRGEGGTRLADVVTR
ncbi:MAG TPA: acetylglutamate kinase [Trueperaceae bacterium]|nr:acetylglutamate kinase [Trueperaceae bacterium]